MPASSHTVDTPQPDGLAEREQLSMALRLAERFGLHEGICNHFSVRLHAPGTAPQDPAAERYLINPYGLHWSEMRADTLLTIDGNGRVLEGEGEVEDTARFIHVAGHRANARHKALLHTHMPWATTLTLLDGPQRELQMAHQTAARFHARMAWDDRYGGLALDAAEGERIASAAQAHIDISFLTNHGVVVGAPSVALAFDDLYYLERACRQQVLALSTGLALRLIDEQTLLHTVKQIQRDLEPMAEQHFAALCRVLTLDPQHPFTL